MSTTTRYSVRSHSTRPVRHAAQPDPPVRNRPTRRGRKHEATLMAWLFLAPALLFFAYFKFLPMVQGAGMSFYEVRPYLGDRYVGLGNYATMTSNPTFTKAIWQTVLLAGGATAGSLVVGFVLALLVEGQARHLWLVRTAAFLPVVTSMAVVAEVWRIMYYPARGGVLNTILGWLGVGPEPFLVDQKVAELRGRRAPRRVPVPGQLVRGGGLRPAAAARGQRARLVLAGPPALPRRGGGDAGHLATMMLPEEVIAIPLSVVLSNLPVVHANLIGTYAGMILPLGAWGFSIIVMTEFMREVPVELEEAARMDGAGELRIFWSVILPMCRPALGVLGVFGFTMIWDQYLLPLIVAREPGQFTLPIALRTLRADDQVGLGVLLAASLLALLPSVLAFLLFQRQFSRGLTADTLRR